jgi:D-glycero-alpha-D-manno-heptose-7-phosphate kinase
MILARAPLRLSLGGGGSDLPAYASRYGGFLVGAAIDKHVDVSIVARPSGDLRFEHEGAVTVASAEALEHPLAREALTSHELVRGIGVTSRGDVPPRTGLGSSGAFSVALLAAIHAFRGRSPSASALAEEAAHLEMVRLGEPVGKQDTALSAHGGVSALTIARDGSVVVSRLPVSDASIARFFERLLVVYTGTQRPARVVLADQQRRVNALDPVTVEGMHRIKAIGHEVVRLLVDGDFDRYGELLHEHWSRKRELAKGMTDGVLDEHYASARRAGARGGKILGAGGGGFFLFYVPPERRDEVVKCLVERGLVPLPCNVDPRGVRLVAGAPAR